MQIGISTSNFYPMLIEDSVLQLKGLGADVTEIFMNTVSEMTPTFAAELKKRADSVNVDIRSLHSYTSCFEPYLLFSQYERRYRDGLEVFKPIFETAAVAGARYVVLHGDRENGVLPSAESIARYEGLYDLGQTFGLTLLQENVVRFRASSPEYIREMRSLLGDKAQFVLDFKQCRRSGVPYTAMIEAMGDAIRHVHISDASEGEDCLMPGAGTENLTEMLRAVSKTGFDGAVIIELYRRNFDSISDFLQGIDALKTAISHI